LDIDVRKERKSIEQDNVRYNAPYQNSRNSEDIKDDNEKK